MANNVVDVSISLIFPQEYKLADSQLRHIQKNKLYTKPGNGGAVYTSNGGSSDWGFELHRRDDAWVWPHKIDKIPDKVKYLSYDLPNGIENHKYVMWAGRPNLDGHIWLSHPGARVIVDHSTISLFIRESQFPAPQDPSKPQLWEIIFPE